MMDALFWYTGLAAWVLIAAAGISMLAADANNRSVQRRTRNVCGGDMNWKTRK
jgi:hypothetical protein